MKIQTHFAAVTVIAMLGLAAAAPARADLTTGADTGARRTGGWSGEADKSAADGAGADDAKDQPTGAKQLKDHLAQDEQAAKAASAARLAANTKVTTAPSAKDPKAPPDDWSTTATNAVRDVVKPLQEAVSGLKSREADDVPGPSNFEVRMPQRAAPAGSPEQQERDKHASEQMLARFIEEVKPWAIGIGIAGALGYGISVWWNFRRWKTGRSSKPRRSSKKSDRRSH